MEKPTTLDAQLSFERLMDAAPVMIWVSGPDKRCTWFNRPWLDFTGRTMGEELGDGWASGVHRDDLERCLDIYTANFDRRTPFRMEYRLRGADGEFRWILDNGVPRFDPDGTFLGYIGSCIDINAIKTAELGLRDTVSSREAALDALDRIASGVAHELRNLVGCFLGYLGLIRKEAHDSGAVAHRVEEAEEAALEGQQIIEQLLASIRHRPRAEMIHLNRLIRDTAEILRGAAGERVSVEMDLAAQPDDADVAAAHLQAALLNLVTNARDAMADGGKVVIETRNFVVRPEAIDEPGMEPGRYVMLAVRDTGAGMSADLLRHAFEPFFTTKHGTGGTGLGLSQVRAFARHSGGTARIESVPGQGTTVRLYLPQGPKPGTEAEAPA
ncbi:MAG TPA: ATP-binding protein [Stellaceae bacterium]|nr:ATP-binding protein [Stellaceae bacterium]